MHCYFSPIKDEEALGEDALSHSWQGLDAYAHPCHSRKDKNGKECKGNANSPVQPKGSVVSRTFRTSFRRTLSDSSRKGFAKPASVRNFTSRSGKTKLTRLEAIVSILRPQGFSRLDAEAVANSLREGSNKLYEGKWARFTDWCDERQIYPVQASLPEITSFLRYLRVEIGLSYSAILGYRSTLNQFFMLKGMNLVNCKVISGLLRGFRNSCSPPRF